MPATGMVGHHRQRADKGDEGGACHAARAFRGQHRDGQKMVAAASGVSSVLVAWATNRAAIVM